MLNNFSISHLSLNLLLVAPFISQSPKYAKTLTNTYYNVNCMKSIYSFLYSTSNTLINFKSSSFTNFQGYNPIFLDKIDYVYSHPHINQVIEIKNDTIPYYRQTFIESILFVEYGNISVTFQECKFENCYYQHGPGGAISFRKSDASLYINSCQFIKCRANYNGGAIYIMVSTGGWLQGDAITTNSLFEECYDYNEWSNYVSGVFEVFLAKGSTDHSFSLFESQLKNCQFDKKNKITEGQLRLNANVFHIEHNNVTNNNEKIDVSAFLFSKYVQGDSTVSFLTTFNQRGFNVFEIYDIQASHIHMYNINMVNTTFTNFNEGSVMGKIAFINTYLSMDNILFIDNICVVDFTTISTQDGLSILDLVEPVVIKLPSGSKTPKIYNIFSNQVIANNNNNIEYTLVSEMKAEGEVIVNHPQLVETPLSTPKQTKIPTQSETPSDTPTPTLSPLATNSPTESVTTIATEIQEQTDSQIQIETQTEIVSYTQILSSSSDLTDLLNPTIELSLSPTSSAVLVITPQKSASTGQESFNDGMSNSSSGKLSKKFGIMIGAVIAVVVVITVIVVIVVIMLQKKRNRKMESPFEDKEQSTGEEDNLDDIENFKSTNSLKKYDPLNMKELIASINNNESSSSDSNEYNQLSDTH